MIVGISSLGKERHGILKCLIQPFSGKGKAWDPHVPHSAILWERKGMGSPRASFSHSLGKERHGNLKSLIQPLPADYLQHKALHADLPLEECPTIIP